MWNNILQQYSIKNYNMQNRVKNLYMQIMLLVFNKLQFAGFGLLLLPDSDFGKNQ
ncbi:hypothetical protein CLV42_11727 [Chitinophaga ginsengisoli]|uniref:Uncharacterized protein n=1 Tax=Chitinophaga ginsengisoli TaxID=363837 RepID=A0A2P8FPQ9_9BACT|nr:hypothetical protein CLV42_11727 [Chitinophaga ginsengisoli]